MVVVIALVDHPSVELLRSEVGFCILFCRFVFFFFIFVVIPTSGLFVCVPEVRNCDPQPLMGRTEPTVVCLNTDNPACGAVLEGLLGSAKCAARAQPTFDNAGKAAAGQCGAAQSAIGDVDPECCPGLRQLVTSVRPPLQIWG